MKRHTFSRALSILMTLVMLLSICPLSALAADEPANDGEPTTPLTDPAPAPIADPVYVASTTIGGVTASHETLDAALAALAAATSVNDKLTLLANNTAISSPIQMPAVSFTLDLNGCMLSGSAESILSYPYSNSSICVITDSSASGSGTIKNLKDKPTSGASVAVQFGGKELTVNAGNIINSGANATAIAAGQQTLTVTGKAVVNADGSNGIGISSIGTVNISGGSVSGKSNGISMENGILNITGGTIDGSHTLSLNPSRATISGGTIKGTTAIYIYGPSEEGVESYVRISGGAVNGSYRGIASQGAEVTVTGGTVSGRYAAIDDTSGANPNESSSITVTGGTIISTNNSDASAIKKVNGYAINVNDSGNASNAPRSTLTLGAATIEAKKGVYVGTNTSVTLSGQPVFTVDSTTDFYFCEENDLNITTALSADASYCVALGTSDGTGTFAVLGSGASAKPENFTSSKSGYVSAYTADSTALQLAQGVTITFHANDGSDSTATQTVAVGTDAALTANSFERNGHAFTEWNTAADGSGTKYANKASVNLTEDLELYAQWHEHVWGTPVYTDKDIHTATCTGCDETSSATHDYSHIKDEEALTITATCDTCKHEAYVYKLAAPADTAYTGKAIEATATVADGAPHTPVFTYYALEGATLTDNKPVNLGKYEALMTVNGVGISVEYTITPRNLSTTTITVEDGTFFANDEPTVTVSCGDSLLTQDSDYTIAYSNNTVPGTGKITLTGKGNFTGTVEKTFTVSAPDTTAPAISGVTKNKTYYTTQVATVTDTHLLKVDRNSDSITVAENATSVKVTLAGNTTATYTISAEDDYENKSSLTVTMKPISTLGEPIKTLSIKNVDFDDEEDIKDVLDTVNDILDDECDNATDAEKKALQDIADKCEALLDTLENAEKVIDMIDKLPDNPDPDDEDAIDDYEDAKDAYDDLTDHEKDLVGDDWKDVLDEVYDDLTDYAIIKGKNGTWRRESIKKLSFTANGPYSKFDHVKIDGKKIASSNYTASKGSTVIALKPAYLEKLALGSHTIQIVYDDGETPTAKFTVAKASPVPETGDSNDVFLWAGVTGAAVLAAVITLVVMLRKRKQQ